MISVLIPVYNYNAFFLVLEIHKQLLIEKIEFEIICLDDGSKSSLNNKNQEINKLPNASFKALEKNLGRSAIRNLLAKTASYNWLLFLDTDVYPKDKNFIKNYLRLLNADNTVFCGGLLYEDKVEHKNLLRYKFGKKKEEVAVDKRRKQPEKYFFTSNFLLPKMVFKIVAFEEKLKVYGREDHLFSIGLKKSNFKIIHIENEVYHLGLDSNAVFVAKTKKALDNLFFMKNEGLLNESDVPLLKLVNKLSKFGFCKIMGSMYPRIEKLTIKQSSVFFLNLLKISYLCYIKSTYK